MQHHRRVALALASACVIGVTSLTPSAFAAAPAAAPITSTTTAGLNVRSGPSLSAPVIGGLRSGTSVTVLSVTNGWATIRYGAKTAYVWAEYLISDSTSAPAPAPSPTAPADSRVTTAAVNVRRGPSTSSGILRTVPPGAVIATTGASANGFLQVRLNGGLFWMHGMWLYSTTGAPRPSAPPKPAPMPGPAKPQPVPSLGARWTTAALNVRETPDTRRAPVALLPQGTRVDISATTSGGWAQIIYAGARRWVFSQYLSTTAPADDAPAPPSQGLPGIKPVTTACYLTVMPLFPQIKTVYGVGKRGRTPGDHELGYALDFMISGYRRDSSVGDRLAAYLQAHAARFNINYVIWQQRIWLADAPQRGWIRMGDRGSDTANHYDHVHVSFNRV